MPATRELFYTVTADASYMNEARLRPEPRTLATSLVGACFSSRGRNSQECRDREFRMFGMANDRSRGCVRLGSAGVTICYAAAGKLGAAYAVHGWIWDLAAAIAIAQAAGCRVLVAADVGQPSISCIVGRGDVVDELRRLLQDVVGVTSWTEPDT
jgi:fructose-1,6-bisphosphatase/inositol monophosphatase family enzyme